MTDPVTVIAACIALAAERYSLPATVLYSIYDVERGQIGMERPNTNGSKDLGLMQINTVWVQEIADRLNMPKEKVYNSLRDDACFNIGVAGWILRDRIDNAGEFWKGVGEYHSKTGKRRDQYLRKVIRSARRLFGKGVFKGERNE